MDQILNELVKLVDEGKLEFTSGGRKRQKMNRDRIWALIRSGCGTTVNLFGFSCALLLAWDPLDEHLRRHPEIMLLVDLDERDMLRPPESTDSATNVDVTIRCYEDRYEVCQVEISQLSRQVEFRDSVPLEPRGERGERLSCPDLEKACFVAAAILNKMTGGLVYDVLRDYDEWAREKGTAGPESGPADAGDGEVEPS